MELVIQSHSVPFDIRVDDAHALLKANPYESAAVLHLKRVVGLFDKKHIGFLLSSQFGYVVYGKKKLMEVMIKDPLIIVRGDPIRQILERISARPEDRFHEDIILLERDYSYLGIISVQNMMQLQESILRHHYQVMETQKKQLEENLEKLAASQQALVSKEKATVVHSLLCGLAHELNNKLSPVLAMSEWMAFEMSTPHRRDLTEEMLLIHESTREAVTIIRRLQQLAKPTRPEMKLVDLHRLIQEVAGILDHHLRRDGIECMLNSEPNRYFASVDVEQMKQVLINLTLNAAQSVEKSSRKLVTFTLRTEEKQIKLEIQDTGCGIPLEIQERIFDLFFTTKSPQDGTGLGLPICQTIIQNHQGEISFKSEPGVGSAFEITLPQATLPIHELILTTNGTHKNSKPALDVSAKKRLLIVDDEVEIRQMLALFLTRRFGWEVCHANHGREASVMLSHDHFDLILSDIRMPEMNGIELLDWIESSHPALKEIFYFMTGESPHSDLAQQIQNRMVPILHKPFSVEDLIAKFAARN